MSEISDLRKEIELLKKDNVKIKKKLSLIEKDYEIETPKENKAQEKESSTTGIVLLIIGIFLTLTLIGAIIGIPLVIIGIILLSKKSNANPRKIKTPKKETKQEPQRKKDSFELAVGIKWFSIIGIAALVIGIGFFIKYAIDNGWIDHLTRIILGIIFGIILMVIGKIASLKENYNFWGNVLIGGGIAINYFIVYASYYFEEYRNAIGITLQTNIILLILIVIISIVISIKENSQIIVAESFFLGYLTSILSGNFQLLTLIYTLLLTLSLVIIVTYKRWAIIGIGGIIATYAVYSIWNSQENFSLAYASIFLISYFVVYTFQAIILSREENMIYENVIMTLLNSFLFFALYYLQINKEFENLSGLFTLSMSLIYFLVSYIIINRKKIFILNLYLAIFYLTITIPLQLNREWVTIIWSIELILLGLVSTKLNIKSLRIASYILALVITFKTLSYDIQLNRLDMNYFLNSTRLISFITTIIAFYIIYAAFKKFSQTKEEKSLATAFAYLAGLFLIIIIFLELNNYPLTTISLFSIISLIFLINSNNNREEFAIKSIAFSIIALLTLIFYTISRDLVPLNFNDFLSSTRLFAFTITIISSYLIAYIYSYKKELSSELEYVSKVYSWASAILFVWIIFLETSEFLTTIILAIFALTMLVIGFNINKKSLRLQGIITLIITILKAFLYDTRNLSTIARTLSFMLLGAILLIASFLFAKYKEKIKEVI